MVGVYIDQWYGEEDRYVPYCYAGPFADKNAAKAWADERDWPLDENAYYIKEYDEEAS